MSNQMRSSLLKRSSIFSKHLSACAFSKTPQHLCDPFHGIIIANRFNFTQTLCTFDVQMLPRCHHMTKCSVFSVGAVCSEFCSDCADVCMNACLTVRSLCELSVKTRWLVGCFWSTTTTTTKRLWLTAAWCQTAWTDLFRKSDQDIWSETKWLIHSDCLRMLKGFADPFWLVPVYCSASLSLFWYRNSRPDNSCIQSKDGYLFKMG